MLRSTLTSTSPGEPPKSPRRNSTTAMNTATPRTIAARPHAIPATARRFTRVRLEGPATPGSSAA